MIVIIFRMKWLDWRPIKPGTTIQKQQIWLMHLVMSGTNNRFRRAVCRSGMLMLLAGGLTLTLYFMLNDTAIPVAAVQGDVNDMQSVSYLTTGGNPFSLQQASSISYTNSTQHTTEYITFPLEYPVYCIAVCGWLGWWIFCVFAGVGLVVLPLELIQQYVGRAGILSADELLAKVVYCYACMHL